MADIHTSMQGTVFWMAPEVINSKKGGYNSKIDIWSMGCVVFEMWTGQRPWSGHEAFVVLLQVSLFWLSFMNRNSCWLFCEVVPNSTGSACTWECVAFTSCGWFPSEMLCYVSLPFVSALSTVYWCVYKGTRMNVPPLLSFRNTPTLSSSRTGPSMASNRKPAYILSHFSCIIHDHLRYERYASCHCALLPRWYHPARPLISSPTYSPTTTVTVTGSSFSISLFLCIDASHTQRARTHTTF